MQMEESTGSQQQQHDSASGDGGFASTAAAAAATLTGPLRMRLLAGMEFNPLARSWSLGRNTAVNYIAWFDKPAAGQVAAAAAAPAGTY